jgi:hypothetical protein
MLALAALVPSALQVHVRTSFEPGLSFGPDPDEPASFTLTGDWRKLRVVLQNDPAWWTGQEQQLQLAQAQGQSQPQPVQQPLLLGELHSFALSVRMLARRVPLAGLLPCSNSLLPPLPPPPCPFPPHPPYPTHKTSSRAQRNAGPATCT